MNPVLTASPVAKGNADQLVDETASGAMKPGLDVYFSADVETDGPIPGPFSILSFALVFAGTFDGQRFTVPQNYQQSFYRELKPISDDFEPDALRVNGLDRDKLLVEGERPEAAMTEAAQWVKGIIGHGKPILVAYPLSFDWSWLYWYFTRNLLFGSKTALIIHPSRCSPTV